MLDMIGLAPPITNNNKESTKDRVKGLLIGIGISLVPYINFLSEVNLKQLAAEQITFIVLSLIPITLTLFFLSWAVSRLTNRWLTLSAYTLFPLLSVGFYLQFHYEFTWWRLAPLVDDPLIRLVTLSILSGIWLAITLLGIGYKHLVKRSLAIFVTLMLFISIGPALETLRTHLFSLHDVQSDSNSFGDFFDEPRHFSSTLSSVQINATSHAYPNVYFVIVDGMLSLESAQHLNIVDQDEVLARLRELGVRYIKQTYSSYDYTYLTLSSILSLTYHTKQHNPYRNQSQFFPFVMREEAKSISGRPRIALLYFLENLGIDFVWLGNSWGKCIPSTKWSCVGMDKVETGLLDGLYYDFLLLIDPFYRQSIIGRFISIALRERRDVDRSLVKFMEAFESITSDGEPRFFLIHHFAPHDPFTKTRNCEDITNQSQDSDPFEGYRDNYLCTLQEIQQFLSMTSSIDPESIVVIQADHGWVVSNPKDESRTANRSSSVFNAIRAPDRCFADYGSPRSTVNSIRFVMNCAYGFRLPVEEIAHYTSFPAQDARFGEVREVKVSP